MSQALTESVVIDGLELPAVWLRDSCSCEQCRDPFSGQRLRSVLSLEPHTAAERVVIEDDDIVVTFQPDGHVSRYSRSWLAANAPGRTRVFDDRSEAVRTPWTADDLAEGPPTVTWSALHDRGDDFAEAIASLLDAGVLLVRDVPAESGRVLEVARTFGFVRTTNYGDLFDVRVEPRPVNLAYTGRAISPHTDNPYREPVPGVQLLHCLTSSTNGGDNVFIDGFSVADALRRTDPSAFETLATTQLTFRYDDEHTSLRASAPTIECNSAGEIRAIRWNDRSVEPPNVAPDRVAEVYRALRAFAGVLATPSLQLRLTLSPGDCIVFDNTRILHARSAFDGEAGARHLQGCYADLDSVASTVAVNGDRARLANEAIAAIERAFASAEGMAYLGEDVTMIQHQLQAGALARAAGCSDSVVVASVLHDVGHIVGHETGELAADVALSKEADAHHDASGARWLSTWFAADVTEPVRLHVAAKRYLVATEPDYAAKLSPASVHTLRLQGGPMSAAEVVEFAAHPHAAAALALRRFDEAAKDARVEAPPLESYRALIARVIRSGRDTR